MVLFTPCLLRAQLATADILGTVTDATGAVVPDAKVTLLNTGTGISQSAKSDKSGEFLFSHVQIGTFKVTVEANGFKVFVSNGIGATTGDRVRLNARLEVGSQVETVQVEASAATALQTDTSNIVSQISTSSVADMPLNGRNVYTLIGQQAGTNASGQSTDPTDARPVQSFSANGQSYAYNNNMIDGMDNNERSLGTVAVEPSIDALQEVKVETNMYSAEYSRTGGGIANLITKSGSNEFHGTLFEFMRNDLFDAYAWGSNNTKTELRQNQFGGSFGGPILKNKAFFFGDYQGWRQVSGGLTQSLVATQSEYDSIHDYVNGSTQYIQFSDVWGYGGSTTTGTNSTPVTVYADQINKLGLAYLLTAPRPQCDPYCTAAKSYNYYGAANTVQNADTYDGRVDYHINDNNTLYGRFSYNNTMTTTPGGWPAATIAPGNSKLYSKGLNLNPVKETNLALDYVHIFSPQTLFEAKASYLRPNQLGYTGNKSWTMSDLGFSCDSNYCYNSSGVYGLPDLFFNTVQGSSNPYSGVQAPYSHNYDGDGGLQGFIENTFQYNASLTMNRKAHSIKAGLTLIRRQINAPASSNTNVYFSANYTGNTLADMAEGLAVEVDGSKKMVVPHFRMWEPSAFIQDDWRVTSKLTLNLGVRYDIYTAWTERYDHISNWDLNNDIFVSPSLLGNNQGTPTANVNTDYGNLAPRIGFAYSLPYSMVLRGGWGLSYFPASTSGQKQFEMLNAPFMWGMTCGDSNYYTGAACSSLNGYVSNYASKPYGLTGGGYNLAYGLPMAQYDTSLATDTSKYSSETSAQYYIPTTFKNSYLEQFNLQLQKQYRNQILTVGMVSSLGRKIPSKQNLNQPQVATSSDAFTSVYGGHYPRYSSAHDWMDAVSVYESLSAANSAWVAGEATYEWHTSHGFNANINYTWSRNEGQGTTANKCALYGCLMDTNTGSLATGETDGTLYGTYSIVKGWQQYSYDGSTSHRAAGTLTYNLPWGKSQHGPLGAVVKGWALNGTGNWNTGAWTAITDGLNRSGITTGTAYPNRVAGVSVKPKNQSRHNWINSEAFSEPSLYLLGNANKSLVQEPRSRDADVGLGKTFSVLENLKLQFRAEAFDVTNTPNYAGGSGGGPGGPPGGGGGGTYGISSYAAGDNGGSGFGVIDSASGNRILQFGLKLIY
jgi:hypothetical protein